MLLLVAHTSREGTESVSPMFISLLDGPQRRTRVRDRGVTTAWSRVPLPQRKAGGREAIKEERRAVIRAAIRAATGPLGTTLRQV